MQKITDKIKTILSGDYSKLVDALAADQYYKVSKADHPTYDASFKNSLSSFENFDAIDCTNVEPLNYPIENKYFHLRSDDEVVEMNASEWLDSLKHDKEGYVELDYAK